MTDKVHENPLVPNKKLRKIYTAMVEARLLDEYVAESQRKVKTRWRFDSIHGQEACRVSTAIDLNPGDLISDAQAGDAMGLFFWAKPDSLLRHIASMVSRPRRSELTFFEKAEAKQQLPWLDDVSDRLQLALGAALAFKTLGQPNIVVVYVHATTMSKELGRHILTLAARLNLPVILVVLPPKDAKKKSSVGDVCATARSFGIPGIPVDASDAVALYRVAQESIGRTRGGDGPVLIECIARLPTGQRENEIDDPILHMKNFLTGRRVCSEAWADRAGNELRDRLAAISN